jgi:predicted alpha/beta hydrolase
MLGRKICIKCEDQIELKGLLFEAVAPKAVVIINSATATKKEFYIPFATFLAENNWLSLVYDYRGIGESKPAEGLKGCDYEYLDWGRKDMVAVLEYVDTNYPNLKKIIVGHSVGGQKVGLMHNHRKIAGMFTFATSSGYWGYMKPTARLKIHFFFEIIRPISHFIFDYTAVKKLGLMEDLPKNITNTWRQWCSVPKYFFDAKFYKEIAEYAFYKELQFPIDVLWANDDYIVNQKNIDSFWKNVKSTKPIKIKKINPSDFGYKSIGHFGFFRKQYKNNLWPLAIECLEKYMIEKRPQRAISQ